ncbi:hypothetical protein [Micromonospora sp. NPDC092111]|uniref:hypothetical protein n=1 Tax=Micromonospora sp. NPDC092111 TaxID=3364289 RepID=UPI003805633A
MDLLSLPARLLARPAAAALGVEGDTPQERAANLRAQLNVTADDDLDLTDRHLARAALWGVTLAVLLPLALAGSFLLSRVGLGQSVAVPILWGVGFFTFWMACLHGLKAILAYHLLEGRWNPRSRWWRVAMLSQTVDVLVALTITVLLQVLVD